MRTKKSNGIRLVSVIVVVLLLGLCIFAWARARAKQTPMTYEAFKALSAEQQIETFNAMTGAEIYALVAGSDENWPVTSYDLISPANAKETIVLFNNHCDLHFNLAWPCYGGFLPESIFSIGELSGKLDVSRDGGDGGCCLAQRFPVQRPQVLRLRPDGGPRRGPVHQSARRGHGRDGRGTPHRRSDGNGL